MLLVPPSQIVFFPSKQELNEIDQLQFHNAFTSIDCGIFWVAETSFSEYFSHVSSYSYHNVVTTHVNVLNHNGTSQGEHLIKRGKSHGDKSVHTRVRDTPPNTYSGS